MEWLGKLLSRSNKTKRDYLNLTRGKDPLEIWNKTGEIGDGAFGKVYRAEHRSSGILAALKRVPIQDETELEDFMVEIDILSERNHPNIVALHEAFFFDEALWIFIEFCAGGAVDDIIIELDHGLSEPQIRCITHQMLQALECLHSSGCIHRDLKAGNILLCPDGSIRLADFGVSARNIKGRQKRDTFIGTPYWMAPEVVVCETSKDNPYDSKADIWSTGVTLIELAQMNPPFHEMSPMRVLLKITRADPPRLDRPSIWSKDFSNFLEKCLTKNPDSRASAVELLQHPFVSSATDKKPLRVLYQEVKSEVVEVMEELPEDADLNTQEEHTEMTVTEGENTKARQPSSDIGPEAIRLPSDPNTPTRSSPRARPHSPAHETAPTMAEQPSIGPEPVTPVEEAGPTSETSSSSDASISQAQPKKDSEVALEGKGEGYKYATFSRVRKFRVDGEMIQSKTTRIMDVKANKTLRDNKRYQEMRKHDFHHMKRLQREEMKECTVFYNRINTEKEQQEKKCELETQEVERRFEQVLEAMLKRQKKEVEKLEQYQIQQFKIRAKVLKAELAKETKRFKEQLKEAEKQGLKTLEATLSKSGRKQVMQKAKYDSAIKKQQKEQEFAVEQTSRYETELKRVLDQQKSDMKALELRFMDAKQDLKRNHTNELWEMEQRQKQDRHQLLRQHLREAFHMQRHQMQSRHQKEIDLQVKRDLFRLDELRQQHLLEKRQLPKRLKTEHKQVVSELRKAGRQKKIDNLKEDIKRADAQYQRRSHLESELMNEKHEHDLETLKAELEANMRELQEIQNEKKMMLTQQENNKLKESDEQHTQDLREWRADLTSRKQVLEEEFRKERQDHEVFYSTMIPHRPLSVSLSTSFLEEERQKAAAFSHTFSPSQLPSHSKRQNRSSLPHPDRVAAAHSHSPASVQRMANGHQDNL